jgi:RNA 2',3'-cyclic 3'-phosphodiesterase
VSLSSARLFVALATPPPVQDEIARAQRELRSTLTHGVVRWTRLDQFHTTLRFLGGVNRERFGPLLDSLGAACRGFGAFELRAEGIGFFPHARAPRVVWVGVQEAAGRLARLQNLVQTACRDFTSEPEERSFSGHVALGRVKRLGRAEAGGLAEKAQGLAGRCFGTWVAQEIEVLQSELSAEGSRYALLGRIPLL